MSIVLKPWFNALLAVSWLVVAGAVTAWSPVLPSIDAPIVTACAGVVAGLLQAWAVHREASRFRAASTAAEVRSVLLATIPGKASWVLSWIVLGGVLLLSAKSREGALATAICSMSVYQAVRELASLPAVIRLSAFSRPS